MIRVHVILAQVVSWKKRLLITFLLEPLMARGIQLIPALIGKPGHKGGNFKFQRLMSGCAQSSDEWSTSLLHHLLWFTACPGRASRQKGLFTNGFHFRKARSSSTCFSWKEQKWSVLTWCVGLFRLCKCMSLKLFTSSVSLSAWHKEWINQI